MAEQVLWTADHLKLQIGLQVLFNDTAFSISSGERVALVGRNGCGKSTLMKVIAGLESVSEGEITSMRNLRISYMPQDLTLLQDATVRKTIEEGASFFLEILDSYKRSDPNSPEHERLELLLDQHDVWNLDHKIDVIMDQLHLYEGDKECKYLSGGELRRVLLGRSLAAEPDLLLLDEPTNHLDVEMISWIEDFLASYKGACLFVTHDRFFLDRIATRIVELDHGKFYSSEGSYADFLAAKEEREYNEDVLEQKRKHFLRSEIEWVRRSPKARLRRNLGRLKRYEEIAAQKAPERTGEIDLVVPKASHLGNRVVELKDISIALGGKQLISHLEYEFTKGMRVGIVGGNGVGKTTLLKMITCSLAPDSGTVFCADTVQFNYVDQRRVALDDAHTVLEEIGEGHTHINLGDERVTVWGYLRRFLFEDDRINTKIERLSGGERARLTLAKILRGGGNFLILDEPTNDLDLSSLRILEESLMYYEGCLVVVSHDRYFLNRVCTHILALERDGSIIMVEGDYDSYLARKEELLRRKKSLEVPVQKSVPVKEAKPKNQPKKGLTYKEERELEKVEERIAFLEEEISRLEGEFANPEFFKTRASEAGSIQQQINTYKEEYESLCLRWEELENKRSS